MDETSEVALRLRCGNPECGYEWEYRGRSKFYATCPRCHYNVNVKRAKQSKAKREREGRK